MNTSPIATAICNPVPPDVAAEIAAPRGKSRRSASVDVLLSAAGAGAARAKAKAGTRPAGGPASSAPSASTASAKASSTAGTLPRELDFLRDPRLSPQEKVFRFLLYLQDKADRDLEAKLKEMAPKSGAAAGDRKGWLEEGLGWLKKIAPSIGLGLDLLESPAGRALLKQVSGPVLAAAATALGAPQLAPVLLQAGPQLVDGLARAYGATAAKASTSTAKTEESTNDQRQIIELQHLMEKQRTTIQLLSNVMRVMHETAGSVVANIR